MKSVSRPESTASRPAPDAESRSRSVVDAAPAASVSSSSSPSLSSRRARTRLSTVSTLPEEFGGVYASPMARSSGAEISGNEFEIEPALIQPLTLAPRRAAPSAGAAAVESTAPFDPKKLQRGDVLLYQRPASKPPAKKLSIHNGILKTQQLVDKKYPDRFDGGSHKTVHVSVFVNFSDTGEPLISEASENRGVGVWPLPRGEYLCYRAKDKNEAKKIADNMERWTTGENPVSYSKTKAFMAAAKVLTDGIDHDEPGSSKKPKTQEPYNEQAAYPQRKTFCSEIVSAAIIHSQDSDEGSSSTWTDPGRTLPLGVHAQLNDPIDFQPMGRFTVEDQAEPKPGLRARMMGKMNKLIPNINNNSNSRNAASDLPAEGVSEYVDSDVYGRNKNSHNNEEDQ
jgi:hypothetical protein